LSSHEPTTKRFDLHSHKHSAQVEVKLKVFLDCLMLARRSNEESWTSIPIW